MDSEINTTPARPGAVTEDAGVWARVLDYLHICTETGRPCRRANVKKIGAPGHDGWECMDCGREMQRRPAKDELRAYILAHPPAAASPEPGAVEVLNELAAAAQEYGNSGSTNSMRRLFAARERADDLLTLRTATPRADATAGVSVDLSDLSRDQLETAYKRLRQASDAALLFFNRYKKPPLSAPSCLRCGRQTTVYAVQHLEIPSVVLCPACAPHATAGGVTEAMVEAAARAMVASVHFGYGDDRWDDIADWLRHKWMSSAREILTAALRAAQPDGGTHGA